MISQIPRSYHDIRNSRMKDFYDIWFIANTWTFDMASLRNAILASF